MNGSPAHLPVPLTPLVGRESVLATLQEQLHQADCRLLTLTGPPGVGKTRLALALATRLDAELADGAWFAALAPLRDADLVAANIAKAVGLREEEGVGSLQRRLADYLQSKEMLLVLDTFEHVRDAAGLITDLLRAAPGLRVLATSRVALRLSGEVEHAVAPLELPPPTSNLPQSVLSANPAVALFVTRARAVHPELTLTADTAGTIVQLCRRLEGLPLAIELAAARSKLFSPQQLLARLDHRFAVLTRGARDLPPRQQSLQAALDWSYDLLAPAEQRLLRRAAVFARSFTLESAAAVCDADVADGVEVLLDHSLLHAETTAEGETRLAMLDTIAEYALARLHQEEGPSGAPQELRRRHAVYFVELAEAAESRLRGATQTEWAHRLEAEHDNLRAALGWCVEMQEAALGWRLAGALWAFWLTRGHLSEGRRWLEATLAIPGPAAPARAKALCGAGILARYQGDFVTARERLAASETLFRSAGNDWNLADALTYLGTTERCLGDSASARTHLEESLALWRRLGDEWGLALALSARAGLANFEEDYDGARAFREESLRLYRAAGDREGEAQALLGLGEVARAQRDDAQARERYEQALDLFRALGSRLHVAVALQNLGEARRRSGEPADAFAHFLESLALFRTLGHKVGIAVCLAGLAGVEAAQERPRLAASLLGSAERIITDLGIVLAAADRAAWEETWTAAAEALGPDAFAEARAEGAGLTVEEAVARVAQAEVESPPRARSTAAAPSATPALTARETGVLALLAEGLSYADIGRRLSISPRTVDAHLRSIYGKLHVGSRHEAVREGSRRQLI